MYRSDGVAIKSVNKLVISSHPTWIVLPPRRPLPLTVNESVIATAKVEILILQLEFSSQVAIVNVALRVVFERTVSAFLSGQRVSQASFVSVDAPEVIALHVEQ
jgi:hypothetical protein